MRGKAGMLRQLVFVAAVAFAALAVTGEASADQRAFGQNWGSNNRYVDWNRFYHYPYVYYPQNFQGQEWYRSADSLYHRYRPEHRIPVYNKKWHNYYPSPRRFHSGHHFILDVF